MPRCNFSFGRRDPLIAGPQFLFWPARSSIATPQFSLGRRDLRLPYRDVSIGQRDTRLLRRDFYFGRRDPRLPGRNFSFGRRDPFAVPYSIWIRCFLRPSPPLLIVARPPQIFKRPVRCPAAIFEEAGVILDCRDASSSFGRRDLLIAGPHFSFRPARSLIAAPRCFCWPARYSIAAQRFFFWPAGSPVCHLIAAFSC